MILAAVIHVASAIARAGDDDVARELGDVDQDRDVDVDVDEQLLERD